MTGTRTRAPELTEVLLPCAYERRQRDGSERKTRKKGEIKGRTDVLEDGDF